MLKSGVIKVTKKDKVLFEQAYGNRDFSNELPNLLTTSFGVASGAKFFTALGILTLIDKKVVSLETTLKEVLPFPLGKIDPDITIYQLLTHTSGVHDYCDEEVIPNYEDLWKQIPNYSIREGKDLLPLFINEEPKYDKGLRFEYNNSGFTLLGIIIEEVSNKSLDEYIDEVIISPLQLKHTGFYELDKLPKNTALGYIVEGDSIRSNIYSIDAKGSGAGGIFTTVDDMKTLWHAFKNEQIISKGLINKMITDTTGWDNFGYGLGVWIDEHNFPYVMGEDPGLTFVSCFDMDSELCITIISNLQEDVFELRRALLKKYL